jgi:hypothetical protein
MPPAGEYGPYAEYVPADLEKLPPMKRQLPQEGSVYDYVYDVSPAFHAMAASVPEIVLLYLVSLSPACTCSTAFVHACWYVRAYPQQMLRHAAVAALHTHGAFHAC